MSVWADLYSASWTNSYYVSLSDRNDMIYLFILGSSVKDFFFFFFQWAVTSQMPLEKLCFHILR